MGKLNYLERKERRVERCKELAAKNAKLSATLYNEAKGMQDTIPFGQPILVGHHSEKRDRNFRYLIFTIY